MLRIFALVFFTSIGFAQAQITALFETLPGQTSDPALSPDGKTLAFEWCKPDYTCGLYTRPFAGGDPRLLTGASRDPIKDGSPGKPHWSPDGLHIAFIRTCSHYDHHLVVLDFETRRERELGRVCENDPDSGWSPD